MIGKTISHYRITEKLGQGGMGVVYKAHDEKLDRYVALKFLPIELTKDRDARERFIHEAKAASALDHTNICTIHEVGETDNGQLYIAMACYDVDSLKDKIANGPLDINQAIDFSLQIAQGMAKAHERGIIHRDLKPGNVLITNDGIAKIIDFGLAKLSGGTHLTKSGTTLGTVAYMSPEQARGDSVDARSDIWSLGIMLFEMLTGKLPFRGEFDAAMLYSITNENPLPVETFRTTLPFDLKLIIARALQKDPKDRYQWMDEIVTDLKALHLKTQTGKVVSDVSESDWKTATKTIRYIIKRHKVSLVWIPGAIVFITIIIFLGKFYFTKPEFNALNRTIAVLPFINNGAEEQIYYADGFSDDIASDLSTLPEVIVISRKSSSMFRGTKEKDSTIAERLGVRFLLKGEVQVQFARVKIKLSLFDNRENGIVWNDNMDVARGDIYQIKHQIFRQVAENIGVDPNEIAPPRFNTSSSVYESFLEGLYYRDKIKKDDNKLAITYFEEAVKKDSNFLPALIALANTKVEHFRQGWDQSEKYLIESEYFCKKALQLDSTYAQAYAVLGSIEDIRGNPDRSLHFLLKSYEMDKNNPVTLTTMAMIYLFELGEPTKGVMYLKQLQEIDPLDWLTALNLGVAYAQVKNYTEAIRSFQRASQLNPQHEYPPYSLGYTYERIGQLDSAYQYYNIAIKINPFEPKGYDGLSSVLLAMGKFSTADSIMSNALRYLPNEIEIFYGLGVIYLHEKKEKDARKIFSDGLNVVKYKIQKDPKVGNYYAFASLFNARLNKTSAAIDAINRSIQLDSTSEDVIMKVTRAYAVLGQKENMLKWYKSARAMNPEYDAAYLRTAIDFEKYRSDVDLLSIAR